MNLKNFIKAAGVRFGYTKTEPTAEELAWEVIEDIRFENILIYHAAEMLITVECGGIIGNEFLTQHPINNTITLSLYMELCRTGVIDINPDHIKVENIAYDIVNVLK